jgi:carnitine-CoA ligase
MPEVTSSAAIGPNAALTVDRLLEMGAAASPNREFLVFEGADGQVERHTWAEFQLRVESFARTIHDLGVRRNAKVNLHLGNRPAFLVAWFACARLGAIVVPTNTASSENELAYQLEHSETELCITEKTFEPQLRSAAARLARIREVLLESEVDVRARDASVPPRDSSAGDTLSILYTSGTTSRPKGVMVSHAAYVYAGFVVSRAIRLSEQDRFLTVLPLFHGNAQYYSVMSVLVSRATLLLMERFSATRYFAQATAHEATVGSLFAAPARMILAKAQEAAGGRPRMRAMVFAQNLSDVHLQEWDQRFGVPIIQLYGMTETVGPPTFNPLGPEARATSIGRVSLGYVCRVVDDEGTDVRTGDAGQLLVWGIPGLSLMSGYYKDPDATAAAIRGNWLWTGDVVRIDDDGFLYFVDRAKDMIKIAGENVAASEVESVIKLHPGVFDAAAIGVPDEIRDERVVAFVVPRDRGLDSTSVIEWCRDRLARFRVPSEVVLVHELPRTAVGKIQKHLLKERYASHRDRAGSG